MSPLLIWCVTDSSEVSRAKVTVESPHGSVKMRAVSQVPVIGPEDDLAGILLQVQLLTLICLCCFIRGVLSPGKV